MRYYPLYLIFFLNWASACIFDSNHTNYCRNCCCCCRRRRFGDEVGARRRDGDSCPIGGGGGDPHFHSWTGQHFSYHGECDLVLYSSPHFARKGLDIHIRTTIRREYSFIQGLVMKFGDDYFEIAGKGKYYHNGHAYQEPLPTFAEYPIVKLDNATWCGDVCAEAKIYEVRFGDYGSIELALKGGFVHVEAHISQFPNATGLLEKFNEDGMKSRNGTLLEDVNEYGQEWQVKESDPLLFREPRYPQYPDRCILPQKFSRRVDSLSRRIAQESCSHLSGPRYDMCVFDVEVTGDETMAYSPMFGPML